MRFEALADELGVKAEYFLDVGRMRIKGLVRGRAGKDEGLGESVEMMDDAFAKTPFGIADTNERARAKLAFWNAPSIIGRVTLSHDPGWPFERRR